MRVLAALGLALCFFLTGLGTYLTLERGKNIGNAGHAATTGTRAHVLPGTLYVAQAGRLYSLKQGVFKQLTPAEGWTAPSLSPDGSSLVAVKRAFNYSDLYVLGADGSVRSQLTHNASTIVERNHWAFFPRYSPDGSSIFFSYDPKDPYNNFRVDLAVYAMASGGPAPGRAWTSPNHYTGGDVAGTPLRGGALLYAKYSIDETGTVHSRLWIQARALSPGAGLTPAADDCGQPSVSADSSRVVMVCKHGDGQATLEVASLDLSSYVLGARTVLISDQDVASPAFSPDGSTIAYYAPARAGGPLQLWVTPSTPPAAAPSASPASPASAPPATAAPAAKRIQVTTDLAFDATAPPAWGG